MTRKNLIAAVTPLAVAAALTSAVLLEGGSGQKTNRQKPIIAGIVPVPYPGNLNAPVNLTVPTITGTTTQGQTLTEHNGTWTHSPTSYAYQWEDCNSGGTGCTNIDGATNQTYVLQASDVGHTIVVVESASNASGTGSPATSAATAVVISTSVPANQVPPTISGTPTQGSLLTEGHGSWTGSPTSYSYQWQDCDTNGANCTNISSATAQTYTLQPTDVGHTVRVTETATNGAGSSIPAASAPTSVVTGPSGNVGTGASPAQCNGSCSNHSWSTSGTAITTTDSEGGKSITAYIYPYIPTGLVTNDASHPVPLVIVFPALQTGSGGSQPAGAFTNTSDAPYSWSQIAATDRLMVIAIFANSSGGYYQPTVYGNPGNPSNCGNSGTALCDQIPQVVSAVQWAESHYSIDTNMIFATGGSKGGSMSNDVFCDTHSEPLFSGISALSTIFNSSGTNSAGTDPPTNKGKCPAIVDPNASVIPAPVAGVHSLMMQWLFSANDNAYSFCTDAPGMDGVNQPTYCLNGGGHSSTTGLWTYSPVQDATQFANPAFGCSNSTTVLSDGNGTIKVRNYGNCSNANAHNHVSVQLMHYVTSGCHSYGCNNQEGMGLASIPIWNFWTTGATIP